MITTAMQIRLIRTWVAEHLQNATRHDHTVRMPPRTAGSQGATSRSIVGTGSMTLAAAIAHSNLRPERYSKISVARATLSSAKVAVLTISESVRLTSFMLEPERTKLTSPALTKHSQGSGVVSCSGFLLFIYMLSPIICTHFLSAFNQPDNG